MKSRPTTPTALVALVALGGCIALVAGWLLHESAPTPNTSTPTAPPVLPTQHVPRSPPAQRLPSAEPSTPSPLSRATDAPSLEAVEVILRGRWGTQPGTFGHTAPGEGNPEGPMAFALGPDGTLAVLDTHNRRVQRFSDGRFVASFALPSTAVQDLVATPDGRFVTLDRLAAATVTLHAADGTPIATAPLVGGPIAEAGAVTAVFADAEGVYVEREHREVVRVLDSSGREDPMRPTLWGRPSRDGRQLLRVAIDDRSRGIVRVSVASRSNGAMDWSAAIPLGAPVLRVLMLDSDAGGRVFVAAEVGTPHEEGVRDASVLVVRLDGTGTVDGTLRLPAPTGPEEVFHPMLVDAAGTVYVMVTTPEGVELRRYRVAP